MLLLSKSSCLQFYVGIQYSLLSVIGCFFVLSFCLSLEVTLHCVVCVCVCLGRYCRAERMYRLEFISNQPISDTEFTKWYSDMVAQNQPLPLMDDVLKKQRQLLNLANYSYTGTTSDVHLKLNIKDHLNHHTNFPTFKSDSFKGIII